MGKLTGSGGRGRGGARASLGKGQGPRQQPGNMAQSASAGRLRPGHVSDNSVSPRPPVAYDGGSYDHPEYHSALLQPPSPPSRPASTGQLQQRQNNNLPVNWNQEKPGSPSRPSMRGAFGTFAGTVFPPSAGGTPNSPGFSFGGSPGPGPGNGSPVPRINAVAKQRPQAQVPSPPIQRFHPADTPKKDAGTGLGKGRGRGGGRTQASAAPAARGGRGIGRGSTGRGMFTMSTPMMQPSMQEQEVRSTQYGGDAAAGGHGDVYWRDSGYYDPPQLDEPLAKVQDRLHHAFQHYKDNVKSARNTDAVTEPELRQLVRKQLKISHKEVSDTQLGRLMDVYDYGRNGEIQLSRVMNVENSYDAPGYDGNTGRGGFDYVRRKTPADHEETLLAQSEAKRMTGHGLPVEKKDMTFGRGERLDASQWQILKDQQTHGGYYKANQTDAKQNADVEKKIVDEKLLTVTSAPGSPMHRRGQQLALDESLSRRSDASVASGDEGSRPDFAGATVARRTRTPSPMPTRLPMSSAFTDRSMRIREQNYSHLALGGVLTNSETKQLEKQKNFELSRTAHTKECKCPVCRPFEVKPAGQSSSLVQYNRLSHFYGKLQRDNIAMLSGGDLVPDESPKDGPSQRAKGMDSSQVKHQMEHVYYDPKDAEKMSRDGAADVDAAHRATMGRKKRVPTAIRSMSEDTEHWGASAGFYQKEPSNCKDTTYARLGHSDSIGNIVPGLTPGPRGDSLLTSAPNKSSGKKGSGEFSAGFSDFTKKHTCLNNADVLRYESGCQILRSTSCPPDLSRSRWNPLTHEGDARASLAALESSCRDRAKVIKDASLLCTTAGNTEKSNISRTSNASFGVAPGAMSPRTSVLRDMAGCTSHSLSERKFKQWRGAVAGSPRSEFFNTIHNSNNMEQVTQNHGVQKADEERQRRLSVDPRFAELCKATEDTKLAVSQTTKEIKDRIDHSRSHQLLSTLQWTD